VWSPKATERGTDAVLAPMMERHGRDRSPLELLERVVELYKAGELARVRRRSALHRSCSFSTKGFQKKKVLEFPFLQRVRSLFCIQGCLTIFMNIKVLFGLIKNIVFIVKYVFAASTFCETIYI
jgi:hypothetical protein